jgi:23S rRNA (adenine1618-N6)-methyltransferase
MHPRNRHQGRYHFPTLSQSYPELKAFVAPNEYGDESIDFANPEAVKTLNRALLRKYYGITAWDIPKDYLCPPIPGRADYIHQIADLLAEGNRGVVPRIGVKGLDIGVGANCIYPIIGRCEYDWNFVGADVNPVSVASAKTIVEGNSQLTGIELRLQPNEKNIFENIIQPEDRFDFTMCNPPFHGSLEEAQRGTRRKWKNLGKNGKKHEKILVNFGGQGAELWCAGGEINFTLRMIAESAKFSSQVRWFSTLVSKEDVLLKIYQALKNLKAVDYRTLDMSQGQKKSRIVAWTFQSLKQP